MSAKSSRIYVPKPEPVPPPSECKKKKPYKLSHFSTCYLTVYSMVSLYFGPYSICPCAQLLPAPLPTLSVIIYLVSKMSLRSPPSIFLLMTPCSISTIIALAFRSVISLPVYRSTCPFLRPSQVRKNELSASL